MLQILLKFGVCKGPYHDRAEITLSGEDKESTVP